MSRKSCVAVLFALIFGLAIVAPAMAIRYGEADAGRHPYVGLAINFVNGAPRARCSGTLIAPTLFLTAGHCTNGADHMEIWFGEDLNTPPPGWPSAGDAGGTPFTHPNYDPNAFYTHDLGVVVLDEPVTMSTYGALPEVGQFDYLATRRGQNDDLFTTVGYGLQNSNPNHWTAELLRLLAHPRLIVMNHGNTGDFSIRMSSNANTGGACFGDSGGPLFFGDATSNLLVGVTSYGANSQCAGTGGVYRIDRADDLNWLATFMD